MNSYYKILSAIVLLCAGHLAAAQNFITQWNLATPGSGATQISFGTATGGIVSYTWQEISPGSASGSGSWSGSTLTITGLPAGAVIRLQIAPTNFERIIVNNGIDRNRLTQVENWGSTSWTSMENAFYGCTNLTIPATDVPDLSGVIDMLQMFRGATSFNQNIGGWDVSNVLSMSFLFYGATSFNQNIGAWDVSNVTQMIYMFGGATSFNQDIGGWDVGNVISMIGMFSRGATATAFNQDIGGWNVSSVTDMRNMFQGAGSFNQDIGGWDVSNVTNMDDMFNMFSVPNSFNQNIGGWDVSNVTSMINMFNTATAFNQDISGWNVGSVTNTAEMFAGAHSFNQNIGGWNVSNVTNMQGMFRRGLSGFPSFNQDISGWNVSNVTNMSQMFDGHTSFNQNIGSWDVSNVTDMRAMFSQASSFNQNIGAWNVSLATDMSSMFYSASSFNQSIGGWNVSNVTNMYLMFAGAFSFDQNIAGWNVSNVTDMTDMLSGSGLSSANYDATLIGWAAQTVKPNVALGANGLMYCGGTAARAVLSNAPNNWVITGDTQNCPALPPTITSFTPTSGPVLTLVTITGTNFSATPANNIVYFGATQATVTAATPTQLAVTVPAGATYQPITVQVAGLTAFSSKPFIVTFTGGGSFDACSLAPKVDFTAGTFPFAVLMADFDGDGKSDVATANRASKTLLVYRNSTTIGSINATSLDPPISRATPFGDPLSLVAADLDGDGKLDIALANAGVSNVSVYRNTSSVGSLSFDNRVDFATGSDPITTKIGDLDNDGKPEIVVCNRFGNSVSVLKNTSSTGGFTAGSFAPKVDFPVGTEPYGVAIADLDEDGKPDIVTANTVGNTISVLRNIATASVINSGSFASKVDFTADTYNHTVVLSDIDGDNKPDIIVGSGTTVSAFRNISTGGITAGSFETMVNIGPGTVPVVGDVDGDGKVDIAASSPTTNRKSVFRNTATPGTISASSFAPPVDFASGWGLHVIGDLDGDGKPELVAANYTTNTIPILRNVLGEISPPSIASFSPSSGLIGTSVTITGTNFSTPFSNAVTFNGVPAIITGSTATTITVDLPVGATTGPIQVVVGCNTINSSANFSVCTPPPAPGSVPNSRCGSGTVILGATGTTDGNYRWYTVSSGGTAIAGEVNSSYPTPVIASTTTYYVSIDNGICEGPRSTVTATINSIPADPAPTGDARCGGGAVTLTATGGTPGQYRWYASAVQIPGETSDTYVTPVIAGTTVYEVSIDDGMCESNRMAITATINTIPILPVATDMPRCDAGTVTVTASGAAGTEAYRWYDLPIGGTLLASTPDYTTGVLASTTDYYVSKIETSTLCEGSRATVQAIINTSPLAPVTTPNSGCSGTPIALSATGSPATYRWYTVSSGGTAILGETSGTYAPTLTSSTSYFVSSHDGTCEGPRQQVDATVHPLPAPPGVVTPAPQCPNTTFTINATGGTNGQYRWYDGPTPLAGEISATLNRVLTANKSFEVSHIETVNNCESPKAQVDVAVLVCTRPTIADNAFSPFIPGIIRIDLTPLLSDPEGNLDLSTLMIVGSMILPSGATATIVGTELVIDYTGIAYPGNETIVLKVCDLTAQCSDETKVTINLSSEISIYNAMSPNGDDKNETFYIENIDKLSDTKENKVTIFNRWGSVVFETTNYDNANKVFKGIGKDGNELPPGTYYYSIKFSSGAPKRTGFISLRK